MLRVTLTIINSELPSILADEAQNLGSILVHFSSDYVFDGSKIGPYNESDPANPINHYGLTNIWVISPRKRDARNILFYEQVGCLVHAVEIF